MTETALQVAGLRIYPVKSLAGNYVDSAEVQPWGLAGDRRWALVYSDGSKFTARRVNEILGLRAENTTGGGIRILDRSGGSVEVEAPLGASKIPVRLAGVDRATPSTSEADRWLSERAGTNVRLVWQEDPTERVLAAEDGGEPGEVVSLADAAPLLLVTKSSMQQLNEWVFANPENAELATPLDIVRFRPNLIVDGDAPFAEDNWARIMICGIEFRRTERCDRCSIPTIDPLTLVRGKEPTRALSEHRMWDQKTWFGIRIVPTNLDATKPNLIRVGDSVAVELG